MFFSQLSALCSKRYYVVLSLFAHCKVSLITYLKIVESKYSMRLSENKNIKS